MGGNARRLSAGDRLDIHELRAALREPGDDIIPAMTQGTQRLLAARARCRAGHPGQS